VLAVDQRGETAAWTRWFDGGPRWTLASSPVERIGAWLCFPGPGSRPRALPLLGTRRALFVVPRESVREELVIEDVDARRVVIERRGLCTLEELVAVSSAQHAFPDAADAIGLLLRSVALAEGRFSPACVEVDERGDVAVFRAGVPAGPNAARLVSMLAHLLCGATTPSARPTR